MDEHVLRPDDAEDVHVLVKYEGMLDIEEAAERRRRGGLALSLDGLAHLYIDVRHAAAGHRHMHCLDVWDTMLHQLENRPFFRQAADPMGMTDHDIVPIGGLSIRHRRDFE